MSQTTFNPSQTPNVLPLTGGTMSGNIAMGSNKVTGLANGSSSTDAAAFGQIFTGFQAPVQATTTTATTVTSSTFTSTALAASITPTSSSHRIKITLSGTISIGDVTRGNYLTIFRGASNLAGSSGFLLVADASGPTGSLIFPTSIVYIDSPASTSSTTYTVYIRNDNNTESIAFPGVGGSTGVIVLEEIV